MTPQPRTNDLILSTVRAFNGHLTMTERTDGLLTVWVSLLDKGDLLIAARSLKSLGARLSMITALADPCRGGNLMAYHFDIQGSTVTLKAWVISGGSIDSIVGLFRNADWHEREAMEFYDVQVVGQGERHRLFLDESVEGAVMERLIPLSVLANAASTKMLWERLNLDREDER